MSDGSDLHCCFSNLHSLLFVKYEVPLTDNRVDVRQGVKIVHINIECFLDNYFINILCRTLYIFQYKEARLCVFAHKVPTLLIHIFDIDVYQMKKYFSKRNVYEQKDRL